MKLPDTNILLYSVNEDSPFHEAARAWLSEALDGEDRVGFAWNVLLGFLRVSTRAAAFPVPLRPADALGLIESWLSRPCALVVEPGNRHFQILREIILPLGTGGNITSDAHLAAIAIEHGAEVYSADSDFGRFRGVRWQNPLSDPKGIQRR